MGLVELRLVPFKVGAAPVVSSWHIDCLIPVRALESAIF